MEGEGTPGAWDEDGGDKTKGEGRGGGVGGGGGVGQAMPVGVWLCWIVTGEGAGNMGGPLGAGEGGFWVRGEGAAIGTIGLRPAVFPGGLLVITGGEGGSGVKLHADHTTDLGGGVGEGAGRGACCRLGTVA